MARTDHRSDEAKAWRRLYKTSRWLRLRESHFSEEPLCVECKRSDNVTVADICDHKRPHKGNLDLFWDPNNLQSLCKPHHDSLKQREELGQRVIRFDAHGWPI